MVQTAKASLTTRDGIVRQAKGVDTEAERTAVSKVKGEGMADAVWETGRLAISSVFGSGNVGLRFGREPCSAATRTAKQG